MANEIKLTTASQLVLAQGIRFTDPSVEPGAQRNRSAFHQLAGARGWDVDQEGWDLASGDPRRRVIGWVAPERMFLDSGVMRVKVIGTLVRNESFNLVFYFHANDDPTTGEIGLIGGAVSAGANVFVLRADFYPVEQNKLFIDANLTTSNNAGGAANTAINRQLYTPSAPTVDWRQHTRLGIAWLMTGSTSSAHINQAFCHGHGCLKGLESSE